MKINKSILEVVLPEKTLEYFNIIEVKRDEDNVRIILEEINKPPVTKNALERKITMHKFHDITITDFPIRGRRTLLTLRRRYWKVEGQKEYLKRDIKLSFPGTKLEQEFADFLKEDGGRGTILAKHYREVSKDIN